ncbi:MAG: carboxypeptidase-like regulatory domain-containing protein [Gemmatimonadetes bacterium]|nr:carboxypeptidase-like regulatory domain-containing protein [Gemmatimonadota bacterium]
MMLLRYSFVVPLLGVLAAFIAPTVPVAAQIGSDIPGVVTDAASGEPIVDAILRIRGTDVSAASDEQGNFLLRAVPAGTWTLEVTHLRYGTQTHEIAVVAGLETRIEVRLAEDAIELEPLVVEAESATERERRSTGASFWEVSREEVEAAIGTSRNMGDLVQRTIPGLRLRQQNNFSRGEICLEFRAAASISIVNNRACNHPRVLIDGVPVADPGSLYASVPLGDIERIQMIPPGEASTRYGSGSLYGVLLIETRRPGLTPVDYGRTGTEPVATFDWTQDPEGHSSAKTFLFSALGNALGLGLGIALARECFAFDGPEITGTCGATGTTLGGGAAVVLPAVGAAMAARFAGSTDLSQGNLVPSLVGAGLMIFPGYALALSEAASQSTTVSTIGTVFLTAGVPLAVTLADKLYRKLR